jgi:hypothetical protein
LSRKLAAMKEAEGNIDEAASLLQELQVIFVFLLFTNYY